MSLHWKNTVADFRRGMRIPRSLTAGLLIALGLGLQIFPSSALPQDYPSRPVRVIVPYPPGGGLDIMARVVSERLSRRWSQPVLVENKPGGASIIGSEFVARSAPDGYTLLITSDVTMTSNPHMYVKLPYDPLKDFAAVTQLLWSSQIVVAHPSVPVGTMPELAALAQRKPGELNYGSMGNGSQPHLLYESFGAQIGARFTNIPYKGLAPALQAVLAGEVQLFLAPIALSRSAIQAGKLKAIAIAAAARSPLLPDVPTLREAGYPNIDPHTWFGVFATGGSPRPVVRKIHADIVAIFSDPEFRTSQVVEKGYEPATSSSPEDFTAFIRSDLAYKAQLIKNARIRAE